jgi:hypothetical protein
VEMTTQTKSHKPEEPVVEHTPVEPEVSIVDRVLGMTSELQTLREQAIADLRNQRRVIDEKLAQLGDVMVKRSPTGGTLSAVSHCRICDIDGHDARQHRWQGDKKRKFTPTELANIGNK